MAEQDSKKPAEPPSPAERSSAEARRSKKDPAASRDEQGFEQARIQREIAAKEARKLKAQREKDYSIWFGLGMFGLVGWSVAVPALIGVALGLWIDSRWPSRYSWSLMLLILGVIIGCANAWNWLRKESRID